MENTRISWADDTFNAWWGCIKVSPECKHCYAETLDKRFGGGHWGPNTPRKICSEKYWGNLAKWDKQAADWGRYRRVFVNSMSDIGEPHPDVRAARTRLFVNIQERQNLAFLLLTKRLNDLVPMLIEHFGHGAWPANLWLGTTVGTRGRVKEISNLRATPARVKFLSIEPLLEPLGPLDLTDIDWTIVGGESGHGARPMKLPWVSEVQEQSQRDYSAFFFKQTGSVLARALGLESKNGEDASEWAWPQELPAAGMPFKVAL